MNSGHGDYSGLIDDRFKEPEKAEVMREKGKGSRSLLCPVCKSKIYAMTYNIGNGSISVPNRRYCPACDKVFKLSFVLEG